MDPIELVLSSIQSYQLSIVEMDCHPKEVHDILDHECGDFTSLGVKPHL
jgi:hypothetical protein